MTTRRGLIFNGVLLVFCLGVPVAAWLFFDRSIPNWFPEIQHRGLYGDQFGALNTLFSGLAFGGVVFTLYLTAHQLRLQQRELEAQTASLQQGQEQLAQQTKLLSEQVTEILPRMHRVSDAEDRLDFAELLLGKAKDRLEAALNMIGFPDKRDAAIKAFADSNAAWEAHMGKCLSFQIEAGPAPSGSTSAQAAATSLQVTLTEERARQVADWASWLLANYDR